MSVSSQPASGEHAVPGADWPPAPRAKVLLGYLDYYPSLVVSKVQGLSGPTPGQSAAVGLDGPRVGEAPEARRAALARMGVRGPAGRAALGRLTGFTGRSLVRLRHGARAGPGACSAGAGRLHLIGRAGARAVRHRAARRTVGGTAPPTLERVLFDLRQEYARHAGHLDVVRTFRRQGRRVARGHRPDAQTTPRRPLGLLTAPSPTPPVAQVPRDVGHLRNQPGGTLVTATARHPA